MGQTGPRGNRPRWPNTPTASKFVFKQQTKRLGLIHHAAIIMFF